MFEKVPSQPQGKRTKRYHNLSLSTPVEVHLREVRTTLSWPDGQSDLLYNLKAVNERGGARCAAYGSCVRGAMSGKQHLLSRVLSC